MAQTPESSRPGASKLKWGVVVLAALFVPVACTLHRVYEAAVPAVAETVGAARDVVKSAGEAVAAARSVATTAQEALKPATITREPAVVEEWLKDAFRIAPPPGYAGAFGVRTQLLGLQVMQLTAVIPQDAKAEEIFQGGRNQIRFSPGSHTIFLAARFNKSNPAEAQEAFAEMEQADRKQPYERVFIEAGGKRVAALRGAFERHGQWNTAVAVFLDGGRMLYAAGPRDAFDDKALAQVLASLVKVHPADDLLYAHATASPRRAVNRNDPCGVPGLKGDYDVVAISVTRGSVEIEEQIDMSGQRVALEDVVVGETPNPVVLLLMGDSPVVWKVGRSPGARIAGVLAQGRHRQAVLGLPESTPITTYSGSDGANACPYFLVGERVYISDKAKIQARVTELFGRGIDELITRKANQRFQVGTIDGPVTHAGNLDVKRLALPDDVMPGGQPGVDWLVNRKKLRVATPEEVAAWRKGFESRTGRTQAFTESDFRSGEVYMLNGETRVPYLAGANSRTFIVPAGVPLPAGDRGHNSFLLMDGYRCVGTLRFCNL